MRRKKGDLPGRVVPPHMRKRPKKPHEYVNVAGWQENVAPIPSPLEIVRPQGELVLVVAEQEHKPDTE